jgi:4-hydroxy-2-oxoglutarate aldolase
VEILNFLKKRAFQKARELQNRLTPLAKAVTTKYGIGGLKMAMDLTGYFGGDPRLPLKKPDQKVEEELKRLLRALENTMVNDDEK